MLSPAVTYLHVKQLLKHRKEPLGWLFCEVFRSLALTSKLLRLLGAFRITFFFQQNVKLYPLGEFYIRRRSQLSRDGSIFIETAQKLSDILKADLHGTIFAYDCRMRFL